MTQPTSIDRSFDTSVVELNATPNANTTFSTTENDPSEDTRAAAQAQQQQSYQSIFTTPYLSHARRVNDSDTGDDTPKQGQPHAPNPTTPEPPETAIFKKALNPARIQHLSTQATYDQWAEIYDTDGNMLQAIDDLELTVLLPEVLGMMTAQFSSEGHNFQILDLGCGTGRNTEKILRYDAWKLGPSVEITGLDFSTGMLEIAEKKLKRTIQDIKARRPSGNINISYRLAQTDCFPNATDPNTSPIPITPSLPTPLSCFHFAISTLVLEHIPLTPFFATLTSLILPNGLAVITNMHEDMGRVSQAGFVNTAGVKVRGTSFVHTRQEVVEEAKRHGMEVVEVRERAVERGDLEEEGGKVGWRGTKWVGVRVWWGLVVRNRAEGG